jgi:UDP-2,3-diacylglucosamine hydrolase
MRIAMKTLQLPPLQPGKKLFFAADFHLSHLPLKAMRERENKVIAWLNAIQPTAQSLFLLGDIFDFWFEYRHVIPKGLIRFQSKLAEWVERGIAVYFIPGNHDGWIKDYFEKEIGLTILSQPTSLRIAEKKICIGHGDELGAERGYRLTKKYIYNSPFLRLLAQQLHPDALMQAGLYIAHRRHRKLPLHIAPPMQDRIALYCKASIQPYYPHDYYIFGHLHHPRQIALTAHSTYFNVGDWIEHCHYVTFDTSGCQLLKFTNPQPTDAIYP